MPIKYNKKIKYKILPSSNIAAEEIIIGQMLLDTCARKYILENTIGNFFALQKHKRLYDYIANAKEKDSVATTVEHLWNQKILKKIGGISHVSRIISHSQTTSIYTNRYIYTQYCIKILQYNYIKRLFAQYSYSILQLSHFYHISIDQIQKKASNYLERVYDNRQMEGAIELRQTVRKLLHKTQTATADTKILSGFIELDKVTNGFKAGELIIVAGRPSMGKTSFAINIAHYAIFNLKLSVQIFSLEMSKTEILDKLVGLASDVSIRKIQQKIIERREWIKIQQVCRFLLLSSLQINDKESSSIKYIKAQYSHYSCKKKRWLLSITCN